MTELLFRGTRVYDSIRNIHGTVWARYNALDPTNFEPQTIVRIEWDNNTAENLLSSNMTYITITHEIT